MLYREFPDLQWLKAQIRRGQFDQPVDGKIIKTKGWPTVILQVKAKNIFRDQITGPFSLFTNLSGSSLVHIDKRPVKIDAGNFFITNTKQEYTLEIENHQAETFNIHFGERFADELISSYSTSVNQILSTPGTAAKFEFYNRLLLRTPRVQQLIFQLQNITDRMREEELLAELFLELFQNQLHLQNAETNLPSVKQSTRSELMKRLLVCSDYIHSCCELDLDLDELASISCLSKFHFLRLFKIVFQQTPHQYLTNVRLQRAQAILKNQPQLEVHQVSRIVGFKDASTFSRSFYKNTGVYPTRFRA